MLLEVEQAFHADSQLDVDDLPDEIAVLARRDGTRASTGATYSANSSDRSVRLGPGATVLTRTPCGPYSSVQDLVREWIVALVAL